METEKTPFEETDESGVVDEATHADPGPPAAQRIIGFIVAAVLIFLAQRDLRKRPPELVRGPIGLWRAVAMVPPGAVVYLIFGRRRAVAPETVEIPIAA